MPFHDIFSIKKSGKNNKKSENKPKIIVDIHEKNSLVPSELVKEGVQIEFRSLKVGDYIVNNTAIERKTLSDLKSSIINRRIFFQLKELKQYQKCFLLIENSEDTDNIIKGFILSTALNYQIPVILTKNERDTAKYLSLLAKKKERESISLRQKIHLSEAEQKQFILEGFPGVGPTTAKALIQKFKTIKNIINASSSELKEILGKRTDSFMKLLE